LLETMIRDFETFAVDLAQQIATEEEGTRIGLAPVSWRGECLGSG